MLGTSFRKESKHLRRKPCELCEEKQRFQESWHISTFRYYMRFLIGTASPCRRSFSTSPQFNVFISAAEVRSNSASSSAVVTKSGKSETTLSLRSRPIHTSTPRTHDLAASSNGTWVFIGKARQISRSRTPGKMAAAFPIFSAKEPRFQLGAKLLFLNISTGMI